MDVITFEIDGLDEVIRAIQMLGDDVKKTNEIRRILRQQSKPAERIMKAQAPRADRDVTYHRQKSIVYKPGNLKRAIKMFNGRNKDYPSVYVGAQAKKPQGSGYYSYFIQYGTKGPRGIKRKQNYVEETDRFVSQMIGNKASGELVKYIKSKATRRRLQVV